MQTFLIHHTPASATQDNWAVAFSLPYIATAYARAGENIWYVRTWLSSEQIRRRLAILFDTPDELQIQPLTRGELQLNQRLNWLTGRLDQDEPVQIADGPRVVWEAFQNAFSSLKPRQRAAQTAMAASAESSQAA